MKVLHLLNQALTGRYPPTWVKALFAQWEVDYHYGERGVALLCLRPDKLVDYLNRHQYDWLFWGWECQSLKLYQRVYESQRNFKILLFGQEQPQRIDALRQVQQFADLCVTSSPVYQDEVDGFLPFGIHTAHGQYLSSTFATKKNQILLTGSYRHSRCQVYERLLAQQPFAWPVVWFPPYLATNHAEGDRFRELAQIYPDAVLGQGELGHDAVSSAQGYIPAMMKHLAESKLHLDFTTNSSNWLKFHEDCDVIMAQCRMLKGGYCPERVLDAMFLHCHSLCLYDKAVEAVVGDRVTYYDSMDDLLSKTRRLIQSLDAGQVSAERAAVYPSLTTENIIKTLATMFRTGQVIPLVQTVDASALNLS
ncbi:MAG: hypothetical protein AAGG02_04865 [Cyanobacteria bacterium P01_H01_bin.15]